MATIAAIAAGGLLGALARYGVDVGIERRSAAVFPWSTFMINLSGCFLVGVLIAAVVDRHSAPQWLRVGLVVGFCRAYTTFSTFAQESLGLVEESGWRHGFAERRRQRRSRRYGRTGWSEARAAALAPSASR
jgi:fluoride exporter